MADKVNIVELEAQIAKFVEKRQSWCDLAGVDGILARGQIAVSIAITRWRAGEVNRGSTPNEIANVMVMNFAAAFQSHVVTFLGPDQRKEQLDVINRMLNALGEEIAKIRVGAVDMDHHEIGDGT